MIRLNEHQSASLLRLPESGMGYQLVRAQYRRDPEKRAGLVLNAEVLLWPEDASLLRQWSFQTLLRRAETTLDYLGDFEVIPTRRLGMYPGLASLVRDQRAEGQGAAVDAPPTLSATGDVFKRFSAFENDHRVTSAFSLVEGSYATTEADSKYAPTGRAAVDRYALPNDDPAVFVFMVKPNTGTSKKVGLAQPNFGKPGGGVEVLFDAGTNSGSVSGPDQIPSG